MLDVDVTGTRRGPAGIDHQDCRGVILEQRGRTELRISKLREDRPKVLGNLGSMNGGKKFGFGGASRHRGLNFGLVCQRATAKHKDKASDRTSRDEVGGVRSIHISGQFSRGLWLRETPEETNRTREAGNHRAEATTGACFANKLNPMF